MANNKQKEATNLISVSEEKKNLTLPPTPLSFDKEEYELAIRQIDKAKDKTFGEKNYDKFETLRKKLLKRINNFKDNYGEDDENVKRWRKWYKNTQKYFPKKILTDQDRLIITGIQQGLFFAHDFETLEREYMCYCRALQYYNDRKYDIDDETEEFKKQLIRKRNSSPELYDSWIEWRENNNNLNK